MIEPSSLGLYTASCCRTFARNTVSEAQRYLYSLEHPAVLGLFTSTSIALIVHKFTLISLRFPLPLVPLVFLGPFLFAFDVATLRLLHLAFNSTARLKQVLAWILSVLIIGCGSTFVSVYLETSGETNWGRMVEVRFIDGYSQFRF